MSNNKTNLGEVTLPIGKAYFTEKEVAERLGQSTKWLQKMRLCGGGIPFRKFGSNVRYAAADIVAFEAEALRKSTSDPSSVSQA